MDCVEGQQTQKDVVEKCVQNAHIPCAPLVLARETNGQSIRTLDIRNMPGRACALTSVFQSHVGRFSHQFPEGCDAAPKPRLNR
jgi:hypothetical protein